MFIRIFVEASNEEEALKHLIDFENIIMDSVVDLKKVKIEQYWKTPEQYCVEYSFSNVIPEPLTKALEKLGNNPYTITNGEKIEEYIFSKTTGEVYFDKIEWILISVDK